MYYPNAGVNVSVVSLDVKSLNRMARCTIDVNPCTCVVRKREKKKEKKSDKYCLCSSTYTSPKSS